MVPKIAKNAQPEGRTIAKGRYFELLLPTPGGGIQLVGKIELLGIDPEFECVVAVLDASREPVALTKDQYIKVLYRVRP